LTLLPDRCYHAPVMRRGKGAPTVFRWLLVGAGLGALAGCGLFQPYPERMAYAQAAFADGDFSEAVRAAEARRPPDRDRLLYHLELGTFLRVMGDFEASNRHLLTAAEIIRDYDERAAISLRDTAAFAAALLVNDTALPYRAAPFERVLVHTYLAMNFLMQNDLDSARVEILRGYALQKAAREAHEKAIRRTRDEARRRGLAPDDVAEKVRRAYEEQRDLLRMAGNVYQNAFTYYLSSLVYELNGEPDEAYIDAKRVYELNPAFPPVRRDLLRLSSRLGFRSDHARWRELFGADHVGDMPGDHGEIVLLYECGRIGTREEIKIPVPVSLKDHPALVTVAVPKYHRRADPVDYALLRVNGRDLARSFALADLDAMTVGCLWDEAPAIALRQLIRAAGRLGLVLAVRDKYGGFASSLLSLVLYTAERADLRSWLSLPRDLQVARVAVPAGRHAVEIILRGKGERGRVTLHRVPVRAGGVTVLVLRSLGNRGTAYYASF